MIAALFFLPWWILAVLAFAGVFFFTPYYEVLAFGFLADLLYNTSSNYIWGMSSFVAAIFIFIAMTYFKKIVR